MQISLERATVALSQPFQFDQIRLILEWRCFLGD